MSILGSVLKSILGVRDIKHLLNMSNLSPLQKRIVVLLFNMVVSFLAFYLSLAIRFGDMVVADHLTPKILWPSLVLIVISQTLVFLLFRIHRGIVRFSSIPDLIQIVKASSVAVLAGFLVLFFAFRLEQIPRSSFFIDWFLLILGLGGGRFSYRLLVDTYIFNAREGKRTIIVGAGVAGNQLFREIRNNPKINYNVVGFVDDSLALRGQYLQGRPILGRIDQLKNIVEQYDIEQILIAIPSATGKELKRIVSFCSNLDVNVKTLPKYEDLIDGRVKISQLANLKIEDLLGRGVVKLNTEQVEGYIRDKSILITGGGGSIGSELCRQVLRFAPKRLVVIDFSEFNLYQIDRELRASYPEIEIKCLIGDVRNKKNMEKFFKNFRPEVIFHAAAYKHVPIMEDTPWEAIRTNVFGTKNVAELASQYSVETFVMISTDKAVNPTNIMGASKRIAEMVCTDISSQESNKTKFVTVRFGNVLGSSGSVIPLFREQIEAGGPVTVTHPEINRFFMSIPEASQLVLQAAAIGENGQILVLDMGSPVKIIDLARQMIRLAGFKEDEIEIKFTGLRPGEKLYEELLADGENSIATEHKKIKIAKVRDQHFSLEKLEISLEKESVEAVQKVVIELVPEFQH